MARLTKKQFQAKMRGIVERMRAQATVASDDSDSAKRQRRELARGDKLAAVRYYFPHYASDPFSEVHKYIAESSRVKGTPTALAAPRGSGKSTIAQCIETLKIGGAEEHFFIIGSQTEDLATGHTIPIKLELEENPRFIQDFGDLRTGFKWGEGDFITKNDVRVLARGIGQKVRGLKYRQWRPGYVRLDDTEDDESAINPKRIKKLLKWIKQAVIPAGREGGLGSTILFIGTTIAKRCAIHLLLNHKDYAAWRRKAFPAITKKGRSYWSKFSLEDLARIKEIVGTVAFQAEYMQDPSDEEGDFREEWLRFYHKLEISGLFDSMCRTTGIDPSLDSGPEGCHKAIITVGMQDGLIYVLDAFIRHCTIGQMVERAYTVFDDFQPHDMGTEDVLFQRLILDDFDELAKEKGYPLPIRGIEQRENKELRIRRLSPMIERGRILFDRHQGDQELLIQQMLGFPHGGNVDGPDALEMAVRMLKRASGKVEYTTVERRQCAELITMKGAY